MPDPLEDQPWAQLGLASSMEQEYLKDQAFFFDMLVKTLQSVLPNETEVKTRGFIKKTPAAATVTFGESRYTIVKPEKGALIAQRTRVVRGIAVKNDEIPVEECLRELSAALEQRAAQSESARNALAAMLGLS
jgi:hypothetical protein